MSARQRAAAAINAAAAGGVIWLIGASVRGLDAERSLPRDFGTGVLVVGGLLMLKWAAAVEAGQ